MFRVSDSVLGGYQKQGHNSGGWVFDFPNNRGLGYLNNQNQRTGGSEILKTSLGVMKELANTQQQLSRQLFDFFKKKLSIIE